MCELHQPYARVFSKEKIRILAVKLLPKIKLDSNEAACGGVHTSAKFLKIRQAFGPQIWDRQAVPKLEPEYAYNHSFPYQGIAKDYFALRKVAPILGPPGGLKTGAKNLCAALKIWVPFLNSSNSFQQRKDTPRTYPRARDA